MSVNRYGGRRGSRPQSGGRRWQLPVTIGVATVGGPNFVQNANFGPLEDKRFATLNRIATAIGRNAAKPVGLDALAPCALTD